MKRFRILLKYEMKLSVRDMNMVIFAVLMPLAILVILGMLNGGRTAGSEVPYTFMEQSFGALCAVSMCAGGLMGLPLVVADYRERKILKRFQVTPASPALLLGVELTVYVVYCLISLATLGAASALIWNVRIHGSFVLFLGSWLLTMLFNLEHRDAGGRYCEKLKAGWCDRFAALFPHAGIFRHDRSDGSHAGTDAENNQSVSSDAGDHSDEEHVSGNHG